MHPGGTELEDKDMRLGTIAILAALTVAGLMAGEVDTFVLEVEGLVCEESSQAVEEALDGIAHIVYVEVDLQVKQVAVDAKPGKVEAKDIIKAIEAAHDSRGSFKAKLKKGPKPVPKSGA